MSASFFARVEEQYARSLWWWTVAEKGKTERKKQNKIRRKMEKDNKGERREKKEYKKILGWVFLAMVRDIPGPTILFFLQENIFIVSLLFCLFKLFPFVPGSADTLLMLRHAEFSLLHSPKRTLKGGRVITSLTLVLVSDCGVSCILVCGKCREKHWNPEMSSENEWTQFTG